MESSTPTGAAGGFRDGAEVNAPSRSVVKSVCRDLVKLDGFGEGTHDVRVWCGSNHWAVTFGESTSREFKVWLSTADADALIGELLAAREQLRMEVETQATVLAALDEVPW